MIDSLITKKPIWILIAILCLGFGLRVNTIENYGLAGDEKYSLFVSQFTTYEGNNQQNSVRNPNTPYFTPKQFWSKKNIAGFNDAIARVDTGNGALYTFFLHYWTLIFGVEDFYLRLPSLIFNLITIVVLYFLTKKIFKSIKLALFVSFLASISPFFINYSQIARNYSLQFLFTLTSTYLFLLIIENFNSNKSSISLYVLYGCCVLCAELCHISVFSLYFAHGLYSIIFYRNPKLILSLLASFIIPLVGLALWLNSDGGKWLFHYVNNSVKSYNLMAKNKPDEYLSPATFGTIFKQFRHLISCVFISVEGLYLKLVGIKNFLITCILSIMAYIIFHSVKNEKLKFLSILVTILFNTLVVSLAQMHYFVLFANVFLLCFSLHNFKQIIHKQKEILLLALIAIIPMLFLIIFAFKDGNTFRIITRYVGFCYATNLLLFVYIFKEFYNSTSNSKYLIFSGFAVQFFFLFGINNTIFEDNPPRYFTSFPEKRLKNPYFTLAQNIENQYQKGDTVLYCSASDKSTPGGYKMHSFSVVDAQLTNFYLPKTAEYIQRVDRNEPNKVFIKKSNGDKIELFDFKGIKYRY